MSCDRPFKVGCLVSVPVIALLLLGMCSRIVG